MSIASFSVQLEINSVESKILNFQTENKTPKSFLLDAERGKNTIFYFF